MNENQQKKTVSLWQLARTCLYIGVTGYGGPAIVGHMKQVFVNRKRWISEDDFVTAFSLSQLLPSATGMNTIEFLGYRLAGSWGAVIASICFILPSLVLMTILSAAYFTYGQLPLTKALFTGLGAVVIALILNATITLARTAIKDIWAVLIAAIAFSMVKFIGVNVGFVILASAFGGFVLYRKCEIEVTESDHTVDAGGRRFWSIFLAVIVGLAITAVATRHTQITRLLLAILHVGALTFGGGFMSIPLFQQEAVTVHHWLTNKEFLDGLALGQITPGPVLITANFIGYKVLGVWGAFAGSLAVFLPGGVGMFVVARQHERVSQLGWLKAMIRGMAGGFIGVLATVLIRLSAHSLTDWKTITMAVTAAVVLLAAKIDPLWVILGGAVVSIIIFR